MKEGTFQLLKYNSKHFQLPYQYYQLTTSRLSTTKTINYSIKTINYPTETINYSIETIYPRLREGSTRVCLFVVRNSLEQARQFIFTRINAKISRFFDNCNLKCLSLSFLFQSQYFLTHFLRNVSIIHKTRQSFDESHLIFTQ